MKRLLAVTAITTSLLGLGAGAAAAETIEVNVPFVIKVKTVNILTGFFDDPVVEVELLPQD